MFFFLLFFQLANRQEHLTQERLRVRHHSGCTYSTSCVDAFLHLNHPCVSSDDTAQVCRRAKEASRADATPTP